MIQHVYLYHVTYNKYPIKLTDIENIKQIVSNSSGSSNGLVDQWDQSYVYIPFIDWLKIIELLSKTSSLPSTTTTANSTNVGSSAGSSAGSSGSADERALNYHLECLLSLINALISSGDGGNSSDVDPKILLVESSMQPVLFSLGYRKPIFVNTTFNSQSTNTSSNSSSGAVQQEEYSNEFKERLQLVLQWIKIAREKSVGLFRVQNTLQQLQNRLSTSTK